MMAMMICKPRVSTFSPKEPQAQIPKPNIPKTPTLNPKPQAQIPTANIPKTPTMFARRPPIGTLSPQRSSSFLKLRG